MNIISISKGFSFLDSIYKTFVYDKISTEKETDVLFYSIANSLKLVA